MTIPPHYVFSETAFASDDTAIGVVTPVVDLRPAHVTRELPEQVQVADARYRTVDASLTFTPLFEVGNPNVMVSTFPSDMCWIFLLGSVRAVDVGNILAATQGLLAGTQTAQSGIEMAILRGVDIRHSLIGGVSTLEVHGLPVTTRFSAVAASLSGLTLRGAGKLLLEVWYRT